MIKVLYNDNYLQVKGHAGFADKGQDVVCAGVSSIIFGLLNGLDELKEDISIEVNQNLIEIKDCSNSEKAKNYLELAIIQLKTIETSYQNFIKVERKKNS